MRRMTVGAVLAMACGLVPSGCGKKGPTRAVVANVATPKAVVEAYCEARVAHDVETIADLYGLPADKREAYVLQLKNQLAKEANRKVYVRIFSGMEVESIQTFPEDNSALVVARNAARKVTFNLKREQGRWRIKGMF